MILFILLGFTVGETIPLLFLTSYGYFAGASWYIAFERFQVILWPSSLLLLMTGGGDSPGDDRVRAISILLNGALYSILSLLLWAFIARRFGAK